MDTLIQDLRYAVRALLRSPAFTAVAVISLALGIGANTAVFTVVNAVLLAPPPFKDAERLVLVNSLASWGGPMPLSFPNYQDLRSGNTAFEEIGAWTSFGNMGASLTGTGEPERVSFALGSASLFALLQVPPVHGRIFTAEEDQYGRGIRVALVSSGLWRRRFGSDPALVGKSIVLDGQPHTVVGILPPSFSFVSFPSPPDIWLPLGLDPMNQGRQYARGVEYLGVIGRLRSDVSHEQAAQDLRAVSLRLAQDYPGLNTGLDLRATPLGESAVLPFRGALLTLLGAVLLVLLIACANVANLMLTRARAREREIAVRLSLGESRGRLLQGLLVESLVLALLGGLGGVVLATWLVDLIAAFPVFGPPAWSRPYAVAPGDLHVNSPVLQFTLLISLATGFFFGTIPAWRLRRGGLHGAGASGMRAGTTRESRRAREGLVIAQIALSLILLAGAGLLVKSLAQLSAVDPGFRPHRVVAVDLSLPRVKYPDAARLNGFFDALLARVQGLPEVTAAGLIDQPPLGGPAQSTGFRLEGEGAPAPGQGKSVIYSVATADYFRALGIELRSGRPLSVQDASSSPRVAVINESMARRFWPGQDPLGKRFTLSTEAVRLGEGGQVSFDWTGATRQVVGVVSDVRREALVAAPVPEVFLPYAQAPVPTVTLVISGSAQTASLVAALRQVVRQLDPDQPLSGVRTMDDVVATSIGAPRFRTLLFAAFGGLALLLSAVGVYGVMAYSVTQRTREIGIRAALGAERARLLRLFLAEGARLALPGVAIGLAGAVVGTRFLRDLLYELSPLDIPTLLAATMLLSGVALLACYLPARAAARVDPAVVLRNE